VRLSDDVHAERQTVHRALHHRRDVLGELLAFRSRGKEAQYAQFHIDGVGHAGVQPGGSWCGASCPRSYEARTRESPAGQTNPAAASRAMDPTTSGISTSSSRRSGFRGSRLHQCAA
jgi:hypothetical protein